MLILCAFKECPRDGHFEDSNGVACTKTVDFFMSRSGVGRIDTVTTSMTPVTRSTPEISLATSGEISRFTPRTANGSLFQEDWLEPKPNTRFAISLRSVKLSVRRASNLCAQSLLDDLVSGVRQKLPSNLTEHGRAVIALCESQRFSDWHERLCYCTSSSYVCRRN